MSVLDSVFAELDITTVRVFDHPPVMTIEEMLPHVLCDGKSVIHIAIVLNCLELLELACFPSLEVTGRYHRH